MKTNIPTTDSENPENWKLGIIYYNKNDKRLFPRKRWKTLGWTISFANPYSVLAFILILAVIVGIFYLFQDKINYN